MITTSKISMDLSRYESVEAIHLMQDDRFSRFLELSLFSCGEPWIIPEGITAWIRYRKADGRGGEYAALPDETPAWQAEENRLTIALAPQVMTVPGAVNLTVTLLKDDAQISTFRILLSVEAAANAETFESEDYFHVPGFLPAPASAQTGQHLRVAAVDPAGHVSRLEAVSPDSGTAFFTEPKADDIPMVFFGGELPQTKDDTIMTFRYISKTLDISGWCKTKAQGSSSMSYPKKNQTTKLYKDADCTEPMTVDFCGWGAQNKFCFKANWVDHSHAKNIFCANLWSEVVASRPDYASLPDELKASPNNGAIDGFPVKLYACGVYQGIYTLNIPKDAWMWNMDEENENHILLCGEACMGADVTENYETAANFRQLWEDENDGDWSVEVGIKSDAVKASLNALISCVKDTDDETFKATLGNYLDVQSAIDYYLLLQVTAAQDNTARNMLLATYDGVKWYCGAYDLDLTLYAAGDQIPENCTEAHSLLWERMETLYADELKARYAELRDTVFSYSNLISRLERFMTRIGTELYAEDLVIYPDIPAGDGTTLQGLRNTIVKRRPVVDSEVGSWGIQEYLYTLPEATVFDGSSTYIDTGVKLFDEPKDFTIYVEMESAAEQNDNACVMTGSSRDNTSRPLCIENGAGYIRVIARGKQAVIEEAADGSWGHEFGLIQSIVLVYQDGIFQFGRYRKNTETSNRSITPNGDSVYLSHDDSLLIGAYIDATGWKSYYYTGTIHSLKIYNRAVTTDEADALLSGADA